MSGAAKPIGIVGLGLIGSAVAKRLVAAGFDVCGYDIDADRRAALAQCGGRPVEKIADIAASCRIVILAVFNTDQVEEVLEGQGGLLANAGADGLLAISASTCDPDRIAALGERLSGSVVTLMEGPLSGTSDQVARGDAVCLVGGDAARLSELEPVLAAIVKQHYYVGALGNGNRTKLAVNLILGLNRAALAEGLVFAERMGLPLDTFLDVARGSAAYSQIMDVKGAKMIRGDFEPHGKIAQSYKDFTLMLDAATRAGQGLPLAETYGALMRGCLEAGEGEWDNAAVIEEIRRRRSGPAPD